nr:WD repeat-containing protein on Y chromosome [Neodiprion pinetum]
MFPQTILTAETCIQQQFEEFYNQQNIEEQCTEEDLINLHEAFLANEGQEISELQLQEAFRTILKIHIPNDEFRTLFKKINLRRNGYTTWDEFITYLLLEFQQTDTTLQRQTLEPPLTGEPEIQRTHHRSAVCRIVFCPEVRPDRTWDFLQGCYLTASRDGVINYWSLDLEYERSVQSTNPYLKVCSTTITDMIVLPDIQILCTSSSERDLRFYDTMARKFDLRVMGELQGMKVTEFKNIHADWVRQVGYYGNLRAFVSCGICSDRSVFLSDATGTRMQYIFNVAKGVSCFDFCEEGHILVTGGPDCTVRVWNPFVPNKPNCILQGHHATICTLITHNGGKRIYSLAKDKCIKVWDVAAQACMQTYNGLPSELGEHTPMSVVYNSITQKLIIASMKMIILTCEHVINAEISDGYTHTKPVSCVLYNTLYKVVVTTGLDSCFIVWNPWIGRRLYLCKNAHYKLVYGERVPIEITAASFDTSEQFLLTGARDGTIKMWIFHSGNCIRNMSIEPQCEITSITWLSNRILCTGWNRHITEFADTEAGVHKKNWETRHTDDVLCTAANYPQALATASYNGELILWRLETGQPYRRYRVNNPTGRYAISYKKETKERLEIPMKSLKSNVKTILLKSDANLNDDTENNPVYTSDDEVSKHQKSALSFTRIVGVYAMIFLNVRPVAPDVGSLLLSLENGMIQVWTHHPAAGYLTSFSAIHMLGDYVMSLATDPENQYLITGHTAGYIKVWLLSNYVLPHPPKVSIALLKPKFPFLWKDRIDGRAKRAVRNQPQPLLLSSVRAHCKTINSLQYIPEARLIISGSSDHTVRLWTLNGRYISTLGTFRPWSTLLPNTWVEKYFGSYRLPPDIKGVGSFTTMKVLNGGQIPQKTEGKAEEAEMLKEVPEHERYMLYGTRLSSPKLGHYYKLPARSNAYGAPPILDSSLAYIPVYTHLVTHELQPIMIPPVPQLIQKSVPTLHSKIKAKGVSNPTKETQSKSSH